MRLLGSDISGAGYSPPVNPRANGTSDSAASDRKRDGEESRAGRAVRIPRLRTDPSKCSPRYRIEGSDKTAAEPARGACPTAVITGGRRNEKSHRSQVRIGEIESHSEPRAEAAYDDEFNGGEDRDWRESLPSEHRSSCRCLTDRA